MILQKGTCLNQTYTLLEEIGSGGGGIVYKAYHERLRKYVVVKRVRERVKGILEGRAEADILKNISQTYLPQVYDFLEIDGEIFTVMDYIPGESLAQVLEREGRIEQARVLKWLRQLSEALEYLHKQNPPVVHSDIKPSNIMLTPADDICLIDFNISLAFDSGMRTSTGISSGYSPPEQYHNFGMYQRMRSDTQARALAGGASPGQGGAAAMAAGGTDETTAMVSGMDETAALVSGTDETAALVPGTGETAAMLPGTDETEALVPGAGETAAMLPGADRTAAGAVRNAGKAAGMEDPDATELLTPHTASGSAAMRYPNRGFQPQTQTERMVAGMAGRGVDERSDIYSLGATLYHLLLGVKPSGDFEQVYPLSAYDLKLSDGLRIVIQKMMEFDPKNRYQNGAELNDAVKRIHELDGEFIRYKKRQRLFKMVTAASFLGGILLTGFGWQTIQKERTAAYNGYTAEAGQWIAEGDFDEASECIEAAKAIDRARPEAYERQIYLLYQSGEYEECIRYGLETLNDPTIRVFEEGKERTAADIFYLIGNACLETEEYGDAADFIEKAIDYSQENSLYYRDLAIALARTGYVDEAEDQLEEAIELGLGEDSIYFVQGEIAYSRKNYGEAAEHFSRVLDLTEETSLRRRSILLSSDSYRALGTEWLDEEIRLLEAAESSGDSGYSMHAAEKLADAYALKARELPEYYEKALAQFQSLYEQGYATRQMMENLAILYQELERLEEAEELLWQMAEKYPEDHHAYKRLAFLEADRQQKKANADRNYAKVKEYGDKARELYEENGAGEDSEMLMLETMLQDLQAGGWF